MNTLAKLHLCSSREEGLRLLEGLTLAELKLLALAVYAPIHGKKADIATRIVERTVGLRLRQVAFASFRLD
jgi:hypothetical protein